MVVLSMVAKKQLSCMFRGAPNFLLAGFPKWARRNLRAGLSTK
jgi:hypothetical protein